VAEPNNKDQHIQVGARLRGEQGIQANASRPAPPKNIARHTELDSLYTAIGALVGTVLMLLLFQVEVSNWPPWAGTSIASRLPSSLQAVSQPALMPAVDFFPPRPPPPPKLSVRFRPVSKPIYSMTGPGGNLQALAWLLRVLLAAAGGVSGAMVGDFLGRKRRDTLRRSLFVEPAPTPGLGLQAGDARIESVFPGAWVKRLDLIEPETRRRASRSSTLPKAHDILPRVLTERIPGRRLCCFLICGVFVALAIGRVELQGDAGTLNVAVLGKSIWTTTRAAGDLTLIWWYAWFWIAYGTAAVASVAGHLLLRLRDHGGDDCRGAAKSERPTPARL
jgi:hypothetical protein